MWACDRLCACACGRVCVNEGGEGRRRGLTVPVDREGPGVGPRLLFGQSEVIRGICCSGSASHRNPR